MMLTAKLCTSRRLINRGIPAFILSLLLLPGCQELKQDGSSPYEQEVITERAVKDSSLRFDPTSPIPDCMRARFNGLNYYPVDSLYRINALMIRNPDPEPFEMPTTTDRRPLYILYGRASFRFDGTQHELEVYQNLSLAEKPEHADHLFIPFRDLTSGKETYGGGRYLDAIIPEGDHILLDFNRVYNPYCAYNGKYSCPIPPSTNHLTIAIEAGEKVPRFH